MDHLHTVYCVASCRYPNCDAHASGPMSCGEIISQAVGNQTELLMEATGKTLEELDFKFNLWYGDAVFIMMSRSWPPFYFQTLSLSLSLSLSRTHRKISHSSKYLIPLTGCSHQSNEHKIILVQHSLR